jgi:hypothetical protein
VLQIRGGAIQADSEIRVLDSKSLIAKELDSLPGSQSGNELPHYQRRQHGFAAMNCRTTNAAKMSSDARRCCL